MIFIEKIINQTKLRNIIVKRKQINQEYHHHHHNHPHLVVVHQRKQTYQCPTCATQHHQLQLEQLQFLDGGVQKHGILCVHIVDCCDLNDSCKRCDVFEKDMFFHLSTNKCTCEHLHCNDVYPPENKCTCEHVPCMFLANVHTCNCDHVPCMCLAKYHMYIDDHIGISLLVISNKCMCDHFQLYTFLKKQDKCMEYDSCARASVDPV